MTSVIADYIHPEPDNTDVFQSTDTAIALARIWQNLFDDSSLTFAYDEDFFVLGASSLLAVSLVNAVQAEFGIAFALRQLLSATQFYQLANLITDLQRDDGNSDDTTKEDVDVVVI